MSGHRNWEELKREFTPEDLARIAKWSERLSIATRLHNQTPSSSAGTKQLRAAAIILMSGETDLIHQEDVKCWLEDLMRQHDIEGEL